MLKINNKKKYLNGIDIIKTIDEALGQHLVLTYEGKDIYDYILKGTYKIWGFTTADNKELEDIETMITIKHTIQKYYPKSDVHIMRAVYRNDLKHKLLTLLIKDR